MASEISQDNELWEDDDFLEQFFNEAGDIIIPRSKKDTFYHHYTEKLIKNWLQKLDNPSYDDLRIHNITDTRVIEIKIHKKPDCVHVQGNWAIVWDLQQAMELKDIIYFDWNRSTEEILNDIGYRAPNGSFALTFFTDEVLGMFALNPIHISNVYATDNIVHETLESIDREKLTQQMLNDI